MGNATNLFSRRSEATVHATIRAEPQHGTASATPRHHRATAGGEGKGLGPSPVDFWQGQRVVKCTLLENLQPRGPSLQDPGLLILQHDPLGIPKETLRIAQGTLYGVAFR